jgi:signal transduction histidine kinase/CheY-like chemotaxis protein
MKVVLVTQHEGDVAVAASFFSDGAAQLTACGSMSELVGMLGPEVGCVIVIEEVLNEIDLGAFHAAIESQPPWSDLPLLLIASPDSPLAALVEQLFPFSGTVTVLQRPLHPVSLVSAVHVALRARQRQLQVRDLLDARALALEKRDEFLAMLAHELRNPLAPIRNAASVLKQLAPENPVLAKCVGMIEKQTVHMSRIVDDLLEVSRLELGKVSLRTQLVDLNRLAAAALETCASAFSAHRHRVQSRLAAEPLIVRADPVRIEQVLGNLLVNASKFTPAGGVISLEVRRDGEFAVVVVTDTGKGIPADMLGSVFELFVQEQNTLARSEGGMGIGLALVKRFVELHGGTARAESAGAGKGSRFEIRLPIAAADIVAGPVPAAQPPSPRRVLVVEDREDVRESLGMLLGLWKHDVAFASNGLDAVASARTTQPDVAIIDVGLPGIDGYEVARRIRDGRMPWARTVKLLALTGYGRADDRTRALEAGFDHHLVKPVDPELLQQLLAG